MTDNISNITLGTENINKVFLGDSLVWRRFSIESLYLNGEQGVWYDTTDLSTMFQDIDGLVPVTEDGDPMGKMLDKSGNDNHAKQIFAVRRPVYRDDPSRLSLDKVDDALVINLPSRLVGTMTLASTTGTATYGVDIPSGNFTLGGRYIASNDIVGLILREGELSADDESKVDSYLLSKGAVKSFAGITDFTSAWYNNALTSFPSIDTSSGVNFTSAWYNNALTSFPSIDTSSGTDFNSAWYNNALTSFPSIDTSSGVNFNSAWYNNALTSFPSIDTSSGTVFSYAWSNNNLTSFPSIDTSSGTDFNSAWSRNNLTSFPSIDTSSGTNFNSAWSRNKLTSFPLIDTSSGTVFSSAWSNNNLTSFPSIDTSSGTDFNSTWYNNALTSFPSIDTSSGTNFNSAWSRNTSLEDFPEHMFDNVKGGEFTNAFSYTNLSESSIDGILVSLVTSGIASGTRRFMQSGGSAPSVTGQAAIDTLRSRGWTVTVTGGY